MNNTYQTKLTLNTDDGARIIKRLAKHWQHKFEITEQDDQTLIPFSDTNQVLLSADERHLYAVLTTPDKQDNDRLQNVVLVHINRMANTSFEGAWVALS